MKDRIKKLILYALIGGLIYVLMSYHFIFVGKKIRLLRKTSYNLNYMFYSAKGKRVESILAIEPLWEAGIGQLLVEEGIMSKDALELYEEKKEQGEEEE